MIHESSQAMLESKLALNRVMEGNRNKDLTEQESEKNIVDNLVMVAGFDDMNERRASVRKTKGVGTGLRLTTDGFILTAYHNIKEYEDDWKRINAENPATKSNIHSWMEDMELRYAVIDQQRNVYPIDTTLWITNPAYDIAIIKAIILKKPEPIDFRLVTGDLKIGDEIKLFGFKDERQYNQYGKVISASHNIKTRNSVSTEYDTFLTDTFLTDAYGTPGFSGGVFTNLRGAFAGLVLYIIGHGEIGHAGGIKAKTIVSLVKEFGYEVNKLNV